MSGTMVVPPRDVKGTGVGLREKMLTVNFRHTGFKHLNTGRLTDNQVQISGGSRKCRDGKSQGPSNSKWPELKHHDVSLSKLHLPLSMAGTPSTL